jgi:hypothetical protein
MNKTSFELLTQDDDHEEAHYVHTINEFVGLIVEHGYDTVMSDLYLQLMDKEGWK